jgi:hypothetical protein
MIQQSRLERYFDKFVSWVDSGHWTARSFRYVMKGLFVMMGRLACIILYYGTGKSYFPLLRGVTDKDE